MNILLTGSSGMIGTHLAEQLLKSGQTVICIDQHPNRWSSDVQSATHLVDLRGNGALERVIDESVAIDAIIHLAANARVYDLVVNPRLAEDNIHTVFNVLEFARCRRVTRIIFSSSREVYGNSEKIIHREDESQVKHCESPYTASKIAAEALIHSYCQCYGIDFIILRFSNVYGMYDNSDRVIPLFIRKAQTGKPIDVFGREKLLDFTHIDDTVAGILLALNRFDSVKNDVFNISCGQGTTILEVAQLIKAFMNSPSEIRIAQSRTGEVIRYIADISKARERLGFDPGTTIVDGIARSITWYSSAPMST